MNDEQEPRVATPMELILFFFAVVIAMALAAVFLVDASILLDPITGVFGLVDPSQAIQ